MTSQSRATRWRAGSRRASPTPPSRARWSIRAPKPRASASTSRSPNELSSPTSPCEPSFHAVRAAFYEEIPEVWPHAFCCRNVNGIVFVGSVKEKTVARNLYAQARARGKAAGIVRYGTGLLEFSPLRSAAPYGLKCWCFTGLILRKWKPLRPRSTSLPAVTLSLSSTTRRWCTGSWAPMSTRCTCSPGGWCHTSRWVHLDVCACFCESECVFAIVPDAAFSSGGCVHLWAERYFHGTNAKHPRRAVCQPDPRYVLQRQGKTGNGQSAGTSVDASPSSEVLLSERKCLDVLASRSVPHLGILGLCAQKHSVVDTWIGRPHIPNRTSYFYLPQICFWNIDS